MRADKCCPLLALYWDSHNLTCSYDSISLFLAAGAVMQMGV